MIEFIEDPRKKEDVEKILHPFVREWFFSKFKEFSLPQLYGVMEVHEGNNVLISAPTGATKTLTAFLSILNELVTLDLAGVLEEKIYAVYISPLKALSNDISVNLVKPLEEINEIAKKNGKELKIRVGVRTGDTTPSERAKMMRKVPHIFISTPESFAISLTTTKFREHLRNVRYCIIDEIHALADNKRGVHLNLSVERLFDLTKEEFCRIGLSATVSPLEEIANYLVGVDRNCKIVDVQFIKKMDLKVLSPVEDMINSTYEEQHDEMYDLIDKLIQDHKTTLIFTNTRAATERVVHHLKEKFPKKYTENIGAHHGSLSKESRLSLENRLRAGELKVVVCSTSLELGLDIGFIDLVICLGSPKGVARFLQRCLPYDAKIMLADGSYKEIGEIVEEKLNIEILSYDEKKKEFVKNRIHRYHKNKTDKLLKLKLHSGLALECTEEHPLLTKTGWKKARDLKVHEEVAEIFDYNQYKVPYIYEMINQRDFYVENRNDFLRQMIDSYVKREKISYSKVAKKVGISQNRLQDYIRKNGRRKSIRLDIFLDVMKSCNIPKEKYLFYLSELKSKSNHREPLPLIVDKDFMWLAGIVASDGSITENKKTKELKIKISNKDTKLLEECKKIFNKFGFYPNILKTKNKDFYSLDCGSKLLAQLMISLGIKKGARKSYNIEISNSLINFPPELAVPYLEGVFEGDGNKNNNIRIFTASERFAIGIHNLLNRIGIINYFVADEAKSSKLVEKINADKIYCIYISRANHVKNFLNYCILKGKKAKFLHNKKYHFGHKDNNIENNLNWVKIIDIDSLSTNKFVYNLTLEKEPNNYFVDSILTHNCGRSGHQLHSTVKGRIIVLDRDDLVECSVMLKSAIERKIDKIHIPRNCLDVLAQQIYGIAIADRINYNDLFKLIKRSYCFSTLEKKDFDNVLNYLSGEYTKLEDRHVYAKIWWDKDTKEIGKKGKLARIIYMTNIGTIPDETHIQVKVKEQVVGTIDEGFLERLKRGDVFVLGGTRYEFLFARGMTAQVNASVMRPPTIPSWFSEMLPLSFDLGLEIGRFRRLMEERFRNKRSKKEILEFINGYLYVDVNGAEAIYNYFRDMFYYTKEIPNDKKLLIEVYKEDRRNYYVFHALYGRRVNDVLSRAIAYGLKRLSHRDMEIGINDNGFYLASEETLNVITALDRIKSKDLNKIMINALEKTEVLGRRFRHCAARALMILRMYKGQAKRVGRQQVSSMILLNAVKRIDNDFSILKEARREVMEDLMDIDNASKIIKEIEDGKIELRKIMTTVPSPFAFNLVLQGKTDLFKIEDKIRFLRRMHEMVMAKIGKTETIIAE